MSQISVIKWGFFWAFIATILAEEGKVTLRKRSHDEVFKRLPDPHPQTWEPPQVSVRVAAQHSQLWYSPIVEEKTGSLALPKDEGATLFIAIAPDLKSKCEKLLSEVYDIRRETLFPDLDGFSVANSVDFDIHSSGSRW